MRTIEEIRARLNYANKTEVFCIEMLDKLQDLLSKTRIVKAEYIDILNESEVESGK